MLWELHLFLLPSSFFDEIRLLPSTLLWDAARQIRPFEAILSRREACVDLVDTGTKFKVCAEIPGIPKDKIDVTITKDGIEISGKAEIERREEEKGFVVRERGYSEICKKMSFPEEVIPEKAGGTQKDSLFEIRIPKKTSTPEVKKHKG